MAVPKSKVSRSRKGMRSSNKALKSLNSMSHIAFDSVTGEPKLSHRMSMTDGYYKGEQVYVAPVRAEEEENN